MRCRTVYVRVVTLDKRKLVIKIKVSLLIHIVYYRLYFRLQRQISYHKLLRYINMNAEGISLGLLTDVGRGSNSPYTQEND